MRYIQLAFDAGDPLRVLDARATILAELEQNGATAESLFDAKILISEILSAQMQRGRLAVVLELNWNGSQAYLDVWAQKAAIDSPSDEAELRRRLIVSVADRVSDEPSVQGEHTRFRIPS
ncbi:MAG TPA: hypothetical protein VIG51_11610 [Candidatus Baltobacteraceae bacterium]|jgi:hypothetical protein